MAEKLAKRLIDDGGSAPTASSRAVATITPRQLMVPEMEGVDPSQVMELVTRPTLTHEQGTVVQVKFLSAMTHKTHVKKTTGEVEQGPPVAIVVDRLTGTESMYVCNAITASELNEKYPNNSYVGKSFAIQKLKPTKGNDYCEIYIVRLHD